MFHFMGVEQITDYTKIAENLSSSDGLNARMVERIDRNNLGIVFWCGEPGIGKTVALQQVAEELAKRGLFVHRVFYDVAKNRTLQEINETKREDEKLISSAELDSLGKQRLSVNLIQDIQEAEKDVEDYKEKAGQEAKTVIFIECPLVGNFGYGAVDYFVDQYKSKAGVVVIATDITTQQHAGTVRDLAAMKKPEEVVSFLNKRYNIWVAGTGMEGKSLEQQGQILIDRLGKSATMKTIQAFREITKGEMRKTPCFEQLVGYFLRSMVRLRSWGCSDCTEEAVRKNSRLCATAQSAAYGADMLAGLLDRGLSEENAFLVANPYNEKLNIWWFINE